jgi:hypothetical protein
VAFKLINPAVRYFQNIRWNGAGAVLLYSNHLSTLQKPVEEEGG